MGRLLTGRDDPFGRALLDRLAGGRPTDIVERDDGYVEVSTPGMAPYFTDYPEGSEVSRARGLLGTEARARRLLKRFATLCSGRGRLVAEALDPYRTDDVAHLAYHARDRERGRLPGQLRMRVRYRDGRTPWCDWLLASRPEVVALLDGTGWAMKAVQESGGPAYSFVLERIPPGHASG